MPSISCFSHIIFILLLAASYSFDFGSALKCFTCDGLCDCRDNQVPETCEPNAFCYTIKASTSGQIVRKGCTRDCQLVNNPSWQKCHPCDDENLCNDQVYQDGLYDDCAIEQFVGLGFGIPPPQKHHHRRPSPSPSYQQQYRRSLSRYGESGPAQNSGGYGSGPRQNDGYSGGSSSSSPQQNTGGYGYAQSPQQQQQSAGPSQNSFLVRSSPTANANDDGDAGSASSPTMNADRNGGSSQSAPRVNAFLDRMSARSVPVGFFGQQQQDGPQQNSFGFNNGGPQRNSIGADGPQQNAFRQGFSSSDSRSGPQQNSMPPEARAQGAPGVNGAFVHAGLSPFFAFVTVLLMMVVAVAY